jgi:hypothetical protein
MEEPDLEVRLVNATQSHFFIDVGFHNPLSIPLTGTVLQVSGAWVTDQQIPIGAIATEATFVRPNVLVRASGWPLTKSIVISVKVRRGYWSVCWLVGFISRCLFSLYSLCVCVCVCVCVRKVNSRICSISFPGDL